MIDRKHSRLEQRLRRALRPVEPPAGFTDNVMAALPRARERAGAQSHSAASPSDHSWAPREWLRGCRVWIQALRPVWIPAAAAAAIGAVLIGAGLWNQQRAEELRARQARDQAVEALRISSQTLNEALHAAVDAQRSG